MNDLSRRTLLMGGLAAASTIVAPASVEATVPATVPEYATGILSPHQDDEVIRLSGYMIMMADRGDAVSLFQATNGAATSVGPGLGISPEKIAELRYREQMHAWDWLTDERGRGKIHRFGLPDGGGLALTGTIYHSTSEVLWGMPGVKKELYVAALDPDHPLARAEDRHPDHVACVRAAQRMAGDGVTIRYAVHPRAVGRAMKYAVPDEKFYRVEGAVGAYTVIGRRSATASMDHLLLSRGLSRVVG